jgi:hypothetical protein
MSLSSSVLLGCHLHALAIVVAFAAAGGPEAGYAPRHALIERDSRETAATFAYTAQEPQAVYRAPLLPLTTPSYSMALLAVQEPAHRPVKGAPSAGVKLEPAAFCARYLRADNDREGCAFYR